MESVLETVDLQPKRYSCAKHGDQGSVVGVALDFTGDLPASILMRSGRKYCICCLIDVLDTNLEQLVEVEEGS